MLSRSLATVIRLAVIYLLMVVPVAALKIQAQIGAAQVKWEGQIVYAQLGINVLVDKGKNVVHLCMVCRCIQAAAHRIFAFAVENTGSGTPETL